MSASAKPRVRAFWCVSNNFGDALTRWLIEKMAGASPIFVDHDAPGPKLIVSGSMINWAHEGTTVWGAGLAYRTDSADRRATYLAVRGPLSRDIVLGCGGECPSVYGDPGLLVPMFMPNTMERRAAIGIVPHFLDQADVFDAYGGMDDVAVIDVFAPVDEVARQIASCERIVASSLHGLIVAAAYAKPFRWARFSDRVQGDGTKFHDFMLSVGADHDAAEIQPGASLKGVWAHPPVDVADVVTNFLSVSPECLRSEATK